MSNGNLTNMTHTEPTHRRSGWVSFAGYLMIVAGIFQGIAGLVAIFKPDAYLVTSNHLLVLDYTQWGWVHLILGAVLIMAASALFVGKMWGRVLAIVLATLSAIANFGFIWAYPLWSILIIVLDVLIIYNVAVYGGREEEDY